jgi:hypothetical protein
MIADTKSNRGNTYDLHSKFDIQQHKAHYVNYLEVIVRPDGTVEYAVPSHQEKLIAVACETLNKTRKQIGDECPPEFYFDFCKYLCNITGCISLWMRNMIAPESITQFQYNKLEELKREKLFVPDAALCSRYCL